MITKIFTLLTVFLLTTIQICAQEDIKSRLNQEALDSNTLVTSTFKTTRIISGHSIETVDMGALDLRIGHRFGDLGTGESDNTFFGLDNSTDILIALEYGLSNKFTLGAGRTKGSGPLKQLYNISGKYALLEQTKDNKTPISLTLLANTAVTGMERNINSPNDISFLPESSDRFSHLFQGLFARKFNENLSLQASSSYLIRHRVNQFDDEGVFTLGGAGRLKSTKSFGLIIEYFHPFSEYRNDDDYRAANGITEEYYDPLGVGFEIETGGHVFHLNFTNSTAILENDFIPYSEKNWGDGEFRFGFTISRVFQLN